MATKSTKKRNWAFVLYPESSPSDWIIQLQQTGLPCAISPLHDRDIDPNGKPKKAHYHVIVTYPGPTTFNAVKTLTDSLHQPIPQPLESVRGYYRYLTHEDNPDKAQYSKSDIQTLNGFDYRDFVELTKTEVNKIMRDIQILIIDADICEYSDLMDYLLAIGDEGADRYDVASSHTYFFDRYITSRRHTKEQKNNQE